MPDFKILSDLATLAKAGYKPNDVKDLLELAKTAPEDAKSGDALDPKDSEKKETDKKPEQPIEDAIEAIIKRESEG